MAYLITPNFLLIFTYLIKLNSAYFDTNFGSGFGSGFASNFNRYSNLNNTSSNFNPNTSFSSNNSVHSKLNSINVQNNNSIHKHFDNCTTNPCANGYCLLNQTNSLGYDCYCKGK